MVLKKKRKTKNTPQNKTHNFTVQKTDCNNAIFLEALEISKNYLYQQLWKSNLALLQVVLQLHI